MKSYNQLTSDSIYVGQTLALTNDGKGAPVATSDGDALIAEAGIGVPYVWGGHTPSGF